MRHCSLQHALSILHADSNILLCLLAHICRSNFCDQHFQPAIVDSKVHPVLSTTACFWQIGPVLSCLLALMCHTTLATLVDMVPGIQLCCCCLTALLMLPCCSVTSAGDGLCHLSSFPSKILAPVEDEVKSEMCRMCCGKSTHCVVLAVLVCRIEGEVVPFADFLRYAGCWWVAVRCLT